MTNLYDPIVLGDMKLGNRVFVEDIVDEASQVGRKGELFRRLRSAWQGIYVANGGYDAGPTQAILARHSWRLPFRAGTRDAPSKGPDPGPSVFHRKTSGHRDPAVHQDLFAGHEGAVL